MSLKKYRTYNRTSEKDTERELVELHFNKLIEDELEKTENDRRMDEYLNAEVKRENFIYNYLEKNKTPQCNQCKDYECELYYRLQCDILKIKVKTIQNEKGIYYKINSIKSS